MAPLFSDPLTRPVLTGSNKLWELLKKYSTGSHKVLWVIDNSIFKFDWVTLNSFIHTNFLSLNCTGSDKFPVYFYRVRSDRVIDSVCFMSRFIILTNVNFMKCEIGEKKQHFITYEVDRHKIKIVLVVLQTECNVR